MLAIELASGKGKEDAAYLRIATSKIDKPLIKASLRRYPRQPTRQTAQLNRTTVSTDCLLLWRPPHRELSQL